MINDTTHGWLPPSVVEEIETLVDDPAPHAVVLGRIGCGGSDAARLLAGRMGTDEPGAGSEGARHGDDPLDVVVLHGQDLEGDDGDERARSLAESGARLVLVPSTGAATVPTDLRGSCSILRLRPWSEDEVAEYLHHCHGAPPDRALVRSLVRATGGQPVFVRHFSLAQRGPLDDSAILTPSLWEHALDRQLTTLGSAAHSLLEELAIGFRAQVAPTAPTLLAASRPDRLVEELDRHALLGPDGELLPLVRVTVRSGIPTHRLLRLGRAVVEEMDDPTPHAEVIAELVADGLHGRRLAELTRDLGDARLPFAPQEAMQWYARSEEAGTPPSQLATRRAEASLHAGDVDAAAHICDLVLASGHAPDLPRAVATAVVAHVERGLVSQARELVMWAQGTLGTIADVDVTTVREAAGDPGASDPVTRTDGPGAAGPTTGAPTLGRVASSTARHGLRESLTGRTADAVAELVKAAHLLPPERCSLSPFPVFLVAGWAALHAGDPATAEAVAGRTRPSIGPHVVQRDLLLGWAALWLGHLAEARDHADRAAGGLHESQLRNRLLLAGLRSGIARRTADEAGTLRAWTEAMQLLGRVEPDLFMLLALGELNIAAVRVRASTALTADLDRAHQLLEDLGSPPLWRAPLDWSGVQAAILADRPADVAPHAAALVHAAAEHPFAARLAVAGRAWMHVLARDFDPADIHAAATGLAQVNQAWEGARLAAHAAARCDDPRAGTSLRELARSLRGADEGAGRTSAHEPAPGSVLLSEREVEVVRLVLDGKTYREVGAALFLSPRTVEHHMARIRRRSGAQSRSELLERLQLTLRGRGV
ncbi:helix-turn-helix transcriptional regulator [Janibacter cremeus]|uniref:helix-turn-helix domain-containing protein n=1 Tax=Janibacter cremeus TaxID=1285192 RepID=UPI0023FA3DB8|nr:helix-turn-helix transcriptional regulator [Janibacter cremeus]WEV78365.1 helix-turn-helix transcriptional regulator [Janibacter cremeus]